MMLLYIEAVSTGVWYLEGSADVASTTALLAVATARSDIRSSTSKKARHEA